MLIYLRFDLNLEGKISNFYVNLVFWGLIESHDFVLRAPQNLRVKLFSVSLCRS